MKKFILTLTVALTAVFFANAQPEQGALFLGGSSNLGLNFGSQNKKSDATGYTAPKTDKITDISFVPSVGYMITDGLGIGLDFSLGMYSTTDGDSEYKSSSTTFGIGPLVRYYFTTNSIAPFAEANFLYGGLTSKYEPKVGDPSDSKYSMMQYGVGAGVAIFAGEQVAFDIKAGYSSMTFKDTEDNPDNYRTVTGDFGIMGGITVFLK